MKKLVVKSVKKLPPTYKGTPRSAIAVAGRSNVGKSTLINQILNRKVAPTSKNPGRTRKVIRYLINEHFDLVDLPGYGFAKVGEDLRMRWRQEISDFLSGHGNLRCLLILVDIRRGMGELDRELIQWAILEGVRFAIVLTKADKLKKNQVVKVERDIRHEIGIEAAMFTTSSLKKTGIAELSIQMLQWWEEDAFA